MADLVATRRLLRLRPLVFVDDLAHPLLGDHDAHHLGRSLRLKAGEVLTVADGLGGWCVARFPGGPGLLELEGEVGYLPQPEPAITVGFVPVKKVRVEYLVQKLTELGVDRIVPLWSERSVVTWDSKRTDKHHQRNLSVAREAAMQSKRLHLPAVERPSKLVDFLAENDGVYLADPEGEVLSDRVKTVVVGPEGGFSPAEVSAADLVGLAGGILRAETAAIVAAAMLADRRHAKG